MMYSRDVQITDQAICRKQPNYTHRVAISNRRLIAADEAGVTFKWKDYRIVTP
jgi:hypothetical protein